MVESSLQTITASQPSSQMNSVIPYIFQKPLHIILPFTSSLFSCNPFSGPFWQKCFSSLSGTNICHSIMWMFHTLSPPLTVKDRSSTVMNNKETTYTKWFTTRSAPISIYTLTLTHGGSASQQGHPLVKEFSLLIFLKFVLCILSVSPSLI
jgi:hypothetical protein